VTLVVLSGSSRGIGRATALALAHRGVDLALISRPSAEQTETERLLQQRGAEFRCFYADLRDAERCRTVAEQILDWRVPDAVVHNAALIERCSIEQTTTAVFEEQLAVNLRAPFILTRGWLNAMRMRRQGRMVFVGSISSTLGTARAAAYCASKWGLVGFVKSLAEELKDSGLMAVAVLPGSVATRMLQGSGFEPRIEPQQVASTLVHYALDAPTAHNGGVVEMFGV
jgi:3-oxoacyl-[acyl-carrier protein] reductase